MNDPREAAPTACTLGADDLKARLDQIAKLARDHLLDQRRNGSVLHLRYAREAAPELKRIVALERDCCAFLKFELDERAKVVELTITAPTEAGDFAGVVFGHFSASPSATEAAAPHCSTACSCRGAASSTV